MSRSPRSRPVAAGLLCLIQNQTKKGSTMNIHLRFGNPFLILIYSLALLLLGDAIGMKWHSSPLHSFSIALLGAVLMVIHDTCIALISIWAASKWTRALKNR